MRMLEDEPTKKIHGILRKDSITLEEYRILSNTSLHSLIENMPEEKISAFFKRLKTIIPKGFYHLHDSEELRKVLIYLNRNIFKDLDSQNQVRHIQDTIRQTIWPPLELDYIDFGTLKDIMKRSGADKVSKEAVYELYSYLIGETKQWIADISSENNPIMDTTSSASSSPPPLKTSSYTSPPSRYHEDKRVLFLSLQAYGDLLSLRALETKIGYNFGEIGYLAKALTTGSWLNEHSEFNKHPLTFQPYNTLGDGIISAIILEKGINMGVNSNHGLTDYKTKFVRKEYQCKLSKKIDLGNYVKWGKSELMSEIANNYETKIMSDLFEAVIGAVFLDGGYSEAYRVLNTIIDI